jgi:hypothetical protein
VAFGFAVGAFVAILLAPFIGGLVFIAALFGTSFGLAHIISRWFRNRARDRHRARLDEEERERRALAARAVRDQAAAVQRTGRRRRRRRGGMSGPETEDGGTQASGSA